MTRILICFIVFVFGFGNAQNHQDNHILNSSMKTPWTDDAMSGKAWDIYPRPQLVRNNWANLNGLWNYAIRPVSEKNIPSSFDGKIAVPFAVESELSGVKKLVGKNNYLWYSTSFKNQDLKGAEQLHLNFGAVDWETAIYVNGKFVGIHKGGFTPFSFNITKYLKNDGANKLVIRVWDPTDAGTQPRGKQTATPQGIWYTSVTGIWQTVWLEKTSENYIKSIKATSDIDHSKLSLQIVTAKQTSGLQAEISILADGKKVIQKKLNISKISTTSNFELGITNPRLWSPKDPFLYDLTIRLVQTDGTVVDEVKSYFGMRKIALGKDNLGRTVIKLNNKEIFQLGLLDQGWWPDGLYTAPTPEAMIWDIEKTREFGFNTIRKHVKVEPALYYYECDKRGVLVWQDMPNGNYLKDLRVEAWQQDVNRPVASALQFEYELREMIDHLYPFPSIVVWVPFNEGWGQYDTERIANWVSYYDPSRLNDTPSGWADRKVGDLKDVHIYPGPGMEDPDTKRAAVIGEFGGLGLPVKDHLWWNKKNWGYLTYHKANLFENRFTELMNDLYALKNFGLSAAIYTQTTDVEGEVNGLITYDRKVVKLDTEKTKKLILPLYGTASKIDTIIKDAEHAPEKWYAYIGNKKTENLLHKKTNQKEWISVQAPFSSYDNFFLPKGSKWDAKKRLVLKKNFRITKLPSQMYFKYYLSKASMKIYINGKLVLNEKYQGGRKRHYRVKSVTNSNNILKNGTNKIIVELQPDAEECAFDMGLYSPEVPKT